MDPDNSNLQKLEEDLKKMSGSGPVPDSTTPAEVPTNTPSLSIPQQSVPEEPQAPPPAIPPPEPAQPAQGPKSGSPIMTVAVVLGVVALLAVVAYVIGAMYMNKTEKPVACTTEAKICEDGTSVGRSGPSCEFEACPSFIPVSTETPMGTASASATPTSSPVSTSTPTSSPSAIPAY